MRPIEIHGYKFKLAGRTEVTNKSVEQVENLKTRLFFDKIDFEKIFAHEEAADRKKTNETEDHEIFGDLLDDSNEFVTILRLVEGDSFSNSINGAILTTGKVYEELTNLPRLVLMELIKESEKEIGKEADFIKTFNMNMSIQPLSLLSGLQQMFGIT